MRYVRWAERSDQFYFRGNCWAQMKRSVSYNVDILADLCGNIRQAQCECAAGLGPSAHCKHILCVLFCLVQFFTSGILNTEQTCTQKLQTFHKAKRYCGSPLKMGDLSFGKPSQRNNLQYDPRNPNYVNTPGYGDYVRNLTINFSCQAPNMAIMQMVEPANPFGLANDHDYCVGSWPDYILKNLGVIELNNTKCEELEENTRGQSKNPLWRKERLHRLQSSNFGRICKLTDRTDADDLAKAYTMPSKITSKYLRHGNTYESVAIDEYGKITGNIVTNCGIFVNPQHPYLGSSPDGIVNEKLLVEVKCPLTGWEKSINPQNIPYLEEKNGSITLSKNHDYYYQIQGQLYCSNRDVCDFIVYTKKELKIFKIEKDEPFISDMLSKLECFFNAHFKAAVENKYFYRDYYQYGFDFRA